jgi:hypothetical protein
MLLHPPLSVTKAEPLGPKKTRLEKYEQNRRDRRGAQSSRALTILEVAVSVAVIVVLAGMVGMGADALKKRAHKAKCIGNMRMIHSGLNAHVLDKNYWPQMPAEALDFEETSYFQWWIRTLEPYGVGEDVWLCPSDKVQEKLEGKKEVFAGSYIATPFDADQYTPFRWNQPWLMERGDFHGKGAHIIMPDGSVSSSMSPWTER